MREIRYEVTDGVGVVTLDAPDRRNALTPRMAAELVSVLDRIDSDSDIGAIVVTGGPSFCAGAELATLDDVTTDPAGDENYRAIEGIYDAFLRLGASKCPTVAAVRGATVGAGMNLALAADLRIVAHDARLLSGFARIGLHPGGGHFALLARAVGREAAAAIGLFGREIDGHRAEALGLAWQTVADPEVEPTALALARHVAADPALGRSMLASFRHETGQPGLSWPAAVQVERAAQMWSFRRAGERSARDRLGGSATT